MSEPHQTDALSDALRVAAARAASLVGNGACLVFARMPGEHSHDAAHQLRAASGFDTPDAARAAAGALMATVHQVVSSGKATRGTDEGRLGEKGQAGITVHPLLGQQGVNGALLVSHPAEPSQPVDQQIAQLVGSIATHIDYAHVCNELQALRSSLCESESIADEKNDELLKLSEALFAQDIELLRNNEKLGKIEKLKNDFIEKMSRELRTPLNNIIEAVISVLTGEHETISESAKESLRDALDEGTAFQRTLENILDLWRIKQGELPVEVQEVSFEELLDEAIFSVQDTLAGKPVGIVKEIGPALPKFRSDLAKVNQILFLLLDNAAKFTLEGEITVKARLAGEELEFAISDTGIGICADDQQFIFDDFYQVDDRSSSRYRGAGLGLTLVRDLLILLDGDITVLSEAGKGTCMTCRVPIELI